MQKAISERASGARERGREYSILGSAQNFLMRRAELGPRRHGAPRAQRRRYERRRVDARIQQFTARLVEAALRSAAHVKQHVIVAQIAGDKARRVRVAQHARGVADFRGIF